MTPNADPGAICLRIRELIKLRGGPTVVADLTGIAKPTLETYLRGTNLPGAMILAQLSHGLKVSSDWLLFGSSSTDRIAAGKCSQ